MTRKAFEQSSETAALVNIFIGMKMNQQVTFEQLSAVAGFPVRSTTPAYQSAKRIAHDTHGVYIDSVRGVGCFRGNAEDMAKSLPGFQKRMKNISKKSIARADLAIEHNLTDDIYKTVSEHRTRACLVYATTAAPPSVSNRRHRQEAPTAEPISYFDALKDVVG